ncbi:hypothetical protein G6F42_023013 [Rhizopus arrhizus]|nr:hypothetical protein G6F42_023013 [Rhizopus arrhizus]
MAAAAFVDAGGVACALISSCCVLVRLFLRKNRKNLSFVEEQYFDAVASPSLASVLGMRYTMVDDKKRSNEVDV